MTKLKVKRTTYKVDGVNEPCILVGEGTVQVRIAKCYHLIGKDTLYLTEFLNGEFNAQEEWDGDYDSLSVHDARELAKKFSVYLN